MYSYFLDPPDPNFQLLFVKTSPSVIYAVLNKLNQKIKEISFMMYFTFLFGNLLASRKDYWFFPKTVL